MKNGYVNDMFRQLEEISDKLDKSLNKINEQSLTIYNLNLKIEELNKTINEKDELIKKLIEENEKLKNKNNKDSTNSSKPSSTNITTPKKKTGANLYNYRVKSGLKPGGQVGHKGYNLSKEKVEILMEDNNVINKEFIHIIKGRSSKNDIVKYKIGISINPYVEKHIFKYNEKAIEVLPKEFYTDVTYDNSIKTLAIELGAYNVISYERLSDFFNVITNGKIKIANSSLVNFLYEFSNKCENTLKKLEENILNSKTIFTDETGTKFNGKNIYVRNYSNNETVLYKSHKNKGHEPIKEDDILTKFCGGIMGDHDTTLSSYGFRNYECNIHFGRYLEELIQNIPNISWPLSMKKLLFEINNIRKNIKEKGTKNFEEEKINEYMNNFDEIILQAKIENEKIKSTFYKDKAKKLYRRFIKYKENHLYFIKDFDVPFDNNLSEQDLRIFKIKTKISGGFRSMIAAKHYVNALSIIKTSIKRKINPYDSIKEIFDNKILFE